MYRVNHNGHVLSSEITHRLQLQLIKRSIVDSCREKPESGHCGLFRVVFPKSVCALSYHPLRDVARLTPENTVFVGPP